MEGICWELKNRGILAIDAGTRSGTAVYEEAILLARERDMLGSSADSLSRGEPERSARLLPLADVSA